MDGASKFVKGDAIAALLILAVNIIGGLIIGLSQHDMGVGKLQKFIFCFRSVTGWLHKFRLCLPSPQRLSSHAFLLRKIWRLISAGK